MADSQSTVSMWVCLLLAVALIAFRLIMRKVRRYSFTRGDYWCLAAAMFIIARLIGNYFLLIYGSTRILTTPQRLQLLQPDMEEKKNKIITGSKLILATRTLLICILWCLKLAVLDLLAKLIMKMPYERKVLYAFWTVLLSSFLAAVITVFVGCRPFYFYWQIYPDPGTCVIGDVWLLTYEITNIVTDVLLMALPFHLILSVTIPAMQRLRILFLFSIGVFLIAISILRIVQGKNSRAQRGHTLWASLEVLFAVIVAVTPTLYALLRNRHEDSSYGKSMFSIQNTARRRSAHVEDGDAQINRMWSELEESFNRIEHASIDELEPKKGPT